MDVHLLVYDLSGGMARQLSMGMLGFQLDAIYHTSIMLNGLEYVYDGSIVAITPGSSHLGRPLEQKHLGTTHLPLDVIEQYLDSLRDVYTVEAYNLWKHNCNNFSNDLATFLLGHGIPEHIVNMPDEVLESPLGRMLMPALEQRINANKQQNGGGILGIQNGARGGGGSSSHAGAAGTGAAQSQTSGTSTQKAAATVHEVSNLGDLESLLSQAHKSCAVVFFTSATCPPCRMLYPLYTELARETAGRCTVIKTDISVARDVASRYSITATPTFITFLGGAQENRWMGADRAALAGNVRLLVQMAWPPHPHTRLRLPTLSKEKPRPVLFEKVPPLPKLLAKMGAPLSEDPAVKGVVAYIEARTRSGAALSHLPDVGGFSSVLAASLGKKDPLPPETLFPLVDVFRVALADPRFSGCVAEEEGHGTVLALLRHVNDGLGGACPYALRLVTLQAASNLFSSPLYWDPLLRHGDLRPQLVRLVSSSFLDDAHPQVRVAAASVLYNVAVVNGSARRGGPGGGGDDEAATDLLPEEDQVELAASVLEAISQEESSRDGLEGMLLALGHLLYRLRLGGPEESSELVDLMSTLDAKGTVLDKKGIGAFRGMALIDEVGAELLGNLSKRF